MSSRHGASASPTVLRRTRTTVRAGFAFGRAYQVLGEAEKARQALEKAEVLAE